MFGDEYFQQTINAIIRINVFQIIITGQSGKTSLLNTILSEYYSVEWEQLGTHSDILFIDNMGEQGIVSQCRNEIMSFCNLQSSTRGKKKTVVLDNIHLMPDIGQQIFYSLIETYREKVNFVTATADLQKVNEKLQSSLMILKIPDISFEYLSALCDQITTTERVVLTEETKEYVIHLSSGNPSVLIGYLEKFKLLRYNTDPNLSQIPIGIQDAKNLCTDISPDIFEHYFKTILGTASAAGAQQNEKIKVASNVLSQLIEEQGCSISDVLNSMFEYIKTPLANYLTDMQKYAVIPIIYHYIEKNDDEIELVFFTNKMMMILRSN